MDQPRNKLHLSQPEASRRVEVERAGFGFGVLPPFPRPVRAQHEPDRGRGARKNEEVNGERMATVPWLLVVERGLWRVTSAGDAG